MKDPLEVKKRKCDYFIPKKLSHSDIKISDHAVEQYVARFNHKGNGNGNAPVRKILKSVLDNGEVVLYRDESNQVIQKGGVFAIIKDAEVKTVYTHYIYAEAKHRILRSWEDNGGE